MRLVTRADFDGLACGTILCKKGIVNDFLFIHPKNIQDDKILITDNDVLTNVPFDDRAGLWFDHHSSEIKRVSPEGKFLGMCEPNALSCARLVYEFYGGPEKMPELADMIDHVDRVDSAHLTMNEVLYPSDWVLLGFICDPRTGLGRWHNFEISNRELMKLLMTDLCLDGDIHKIMANRHIKARVDVYHEQQALYDAMILRNSKMVGDVLVIDLREQSIIYTGNRFKPYAMYPDCRVSVTLMKGKGNQGSVAAVGKSIFQDYDLDIGDLMLQYGGGGHKFVGTCQFADTYAPEIEDIIAKLANPGTERGSTNEEE